MSSIERRISVLEGGIPASSLRLFSDAELESKIEVLCVACGTTLHQELERNGGLDGFLRAVREELRAEGVQPEMNRGKH